jgi:hypothetical protein
LAEVTGGFNSVFVIGNSQYFPSNKIFSSSYKKRPQCGHF